ncbi:MAG TPA: phosphoglycerate kinase [Stellaceae bacterium]|nr:phosphoglycerate kinase [Stellaceae bacterium]
MPKFLTLDDIDPIGKTVLLRADLNVPMADGRVSDATRLERLAPTILELGDKGARVVVMSHFGRPKDREPDLSLAPIVPALARALGGRPVAFVHECIGPAARRAVRELRARSDGEPFSVGMAGFSVSPSSTASILLLENLRYHKEEEANDPSFARGLAALGDFYVNDAFSVSHRAHASVEAITHLMPSIAGRLMQAELHALAAALEAPARPVMAIVGGAKVSTKLDLLNHMLSKVDVLVIGGAMANTLLHAKGVEIGTSLVERDMEETARGLVERAAKQGKELVLPVDAVIAAKLAPGVPTDKVAIDRVPADQMILDIGRRSVEEIGERLRGCRTLLWNGPVGAFETKPFDAGTTALAKRVAALTRQGHLTSVAGGGDTVAALATAGVTDDFTYVSTAGGAFLEWIEGRELPGVVALTRAAAR